MLYNLLYSLYFKIPFRNESLFHRLYIRFFNIVIPFYFKLRLSKPKLKEPINNIVVSLTSFPERINLVPLVIESILYQKMQPSQIVLWLSEEEFPSKLKLTRWLVDLQKRGLIIRFVEENLKPHKKYFYAFKAFPDSSILTIDDDEYYPPNLIMDFMQYHCKFPKVIIGSKAREITFFQNTFKSYNDWVICKGFHPPSANLLNIGSGGILYPSLSLSERIFDKNLLLQHALLADDLWIKFANENKDVKNMCIGHRFKQIFIPIIAVNQTPSLFDLNVNQCSNDKVLHDLYENLSIDVSLYQPPLKNSAVF